MHRGSKRRYCSRTLTIYCERVSLTIPIKYMSGISRTIPVGIITVH
jgi:hypothetical protein